MKTFKLNKKPKNCQIFINRQSGFTLMELLVVISIIGVLIGVVSFAFSTAQRQGRNARRRQDIKESQNAFEQYFAEFGAYPTVATIDDAFQSTRPTDPKNSGGYVYNWTYVDANGYCVCAVLEDETGNADAPGSTTCTLNSAGTNFCAQSQQ